MKNNPTNIKEPLTNNDSFFVFFINLISLNLKKNKR